jgi:putative endonuclease
VEHEKAVAFVFTTRDGVPQPRDSPGNYNIMYTVYILRSKKSGRTYIGQTDDLTKRLVRHNTGQVKSSKHDAPFDLMAKKEVASRSEAMRLEKFLKKQKGGQGLDTLLRGMEQ